MNRSVLIVEDSADVRSGLQIALESQGYNVQAAADGRDGIKQFREFQPDIALLDIRMPRMSGIDVCTLIRHESDVPVIMFSGLDESDDVRLAIQRGATDYVLKDTGFRVLLDRVSKHLNRRAADVLMQSATPVLSADRVVPFTPAASAEDNGIPQETAGSSVKAKKSSVPAGLKIQTLKVEAPSTASVDPSGPLENLVIVAHSDPEALAELTAVAGLIGFEIATASTGREAIEILAVRRPKLLLISNALSDMNGLGVVKAVSNHPLGELMGTVLALDRRSPEIARRARYMGVQESIFRPWGDGRLDLAMRSALAATRVARSRLEAA